MKKTADSRLEKSMNFPTRSCERLGFVRCELRADPKSGASYDKAKVSCELRAKIKINVIFVKCLCGDTYNTLLEVEPKNHIEEGYGGVIPPLEKELSANLAFFGRSYNLLGTFATFKQKVHSVLDHLVRPNRYLACFWQYNRYLRKVPSAHPTTFQQLVQLVR